METSTLEKRTLSSSEILALNKKYRKLSVRERVNELYHDFELNEIMLTSSFATSSAFLLHEFSEVNKNQTIYFIDTKYHFNETIDYKRKLTELYGLKVESIGANKIDNDFTTRNETWKESPEFCCDINKVRPLQLIKDRFTVWASGLMEWQTNHRASLNIFEQRNGILKFYPLLDVTKEEREKYIRENELPFHPLIAKGYSSVGCKHCTIPGNGRDGRWNNNPKTECGLHL
ncbi:MAG: phosphoadenylyl-sulfate reductase [Urechidicola sp.]|nr:phosphoadenylyl-sulfate reductase [Urechidicola sp.]